MFSLFFLLLFFCCCCYIHIISDTIVHISVDKCIESNDHCHQKCWKPCKWKWKNKQTWKGKRIFCASQLWSSTCINESRHWDTQGCRSSLDSYPKQIHKSISCLFFFVVVFFVVVTYTSFRILSSIFPWISVLRATAIVTRNVGNGSKWKCCKCCKWKWKCCKWKCKNKQRHKKENVFIVHHNCEVALASMNPGTEIHKAVEVRYILTPSKSIKIFLVCSDIEYFDNFQVQHYSFHHHPSKGNEVKIVDCDGNSYTQKLRQEQQKNNG